jgi:hypothetical protein
LQNEEIYIHAALPNAPKLLDMKMIDCSWDLTIIMQQFKKEMEHVSAKKLKQAFFFKLL